METISPKAKRFKIALSFAGERRAFVADIAQHLSTHLGKDSVLYDHYYEAECVPYRPEGLAGLQPLYQAVAHGCLAGLHQDACNEVYTNRILRGTKQGGYYSAKKLGTYGADLGALACFFVEPWQRLPPVLSEAAQAWLLNEAATRLRALGRLEEALEPMRAGAEMYAKHEQWEQAAASYGNLSELQLSLGQVPPALADARQSANHAGRSGNTSWRIASRTKIADALHKYGERENAAALFADAEAMQVVRQPEYPLLFSLRGFIYCDMLLAGAERAAWGVMQSHPLADAEKPNLLGVCTTVGERAVQTLKWVLTFDQDKLSAALDHFTPARCILYAAVLQGQPSDAYAAARQEIDGAVTGLRASGDQDMLPRGLLTCAWLNFCQGDETTARADLDEAERIASRGNMRLHLADIHLTRARLFRDRDALQQARTLIEQCEYFRRLQELEDAEMWSAAA